ncbi:MAG: thioredoxin fold domain-containing protein [Acidobacteriota bacterium]
MRRLLLWALLIPCAVEAGVIQDVRAAIAKGDFAGGDRLIAAYRAQQGVTAEMLEALSWLGRGALAAKQLDRAEAYASETRKLALEQLKSRKLDAERRLPIALGASIEVQAQAMAARGERGEAVSFLQQEVKAWWDTSIRTRIQKNINLLSLEGKPAPSLDAREWLGPKPPPQDEWKGRPVLLFFWAHWCGDCKRQAPVLAKLKAAYPALLVIGPTQRYGYVARGQEAPPAEELKYIDEVRRTHYAELPDMPAPVSEENFKSYGASTTPTLVLIDGRGSVRLYHPGNMAYEELAGRVTRLF